MKIETNIKLILNIAIVICLIFSIFNIGIFVVKTSRYNNIAQTSSNEIVKDVDKIVTLDNIINEYFQKFNEKNIDYLENVSISASNSYNWLKANFEKISTYDVSKIVKLDTSLYKVSIMANDNVEFNITILLTDNYFNISDISIG